MTSNWAVPAQCSYWEMLEKTCYTSCRENCPSSKMLLGTLSQGVLLLCDASQFHASPPPLSSCIPGMPQ